MRVRHDRAFAPEGAWAEELQELQARRAQGAAMGGEAALAKLRAQGRLNVRERIAQLFDEGSFLEMGRTAGKGHQDAQGRFARLDPTNSVIGTGRIDGRKVAQGASFREGLVSKASGLADDPAEKIGRAHV